MKFFTLILPLLISLTANASVSCPIFNSSKDFGKFSILLEVGLIKKGYTFVANEADAAWSLDDITFCVPHSCQSVITIYPKAKHIKRHLAEGAFGDSFFGPPSSVRALKRAIRKIPHCEDLEEILTDPRNTNSFPY